MKLIPKPPEGEYAPYTIMYIGLLPDDGLVLKHLENNLEATSRLMRSLPKALLTHRLADNEWTIKEILVHIIDDERIYAYRALRYARNDTTELPGFEQDEYVPYSMANVRSLDAILHELAAVRRSTIALFESFDDTALQRRGIGSGNIMSVRAAAYHIAGHELHHIDSIRQNFNLDTDLVI